MRQPVGIIRRKRFWIGHGCAERVIREWKNISPCQGIACSDRRAQQSVFCQSSRPVLAEPLFERAALIGPAVMVVRSRHIRRNSRKVWWMRNRGEKLRGSDVGAAKHSDFS